MGLFSSRRLAHGAIVGVLLAGGLAQTADAAHKQHRRARASQLEVGRNPTIKPVRPVPTTCNAWASTTGDDANPGTKARPFRTVQRLVDTLGPGRTACVAEGDYVGNVSIRNGGTELERATLRTGGRGRARLIGHFWIADSANFVNVAFLDLDGTSPEPKTSPIINGDDAWLYGNDITNTNQVCVYTGDLVYGLPWRLHLQGNRIHDCGYTGTNKLHGIYAARGRDMLIEDNWIYNNPDRGIQLYPETTGTVIRHNVIDGNGEGIIFSGEYGVASRDNLVTGNLITNSRLRNDVESWYPEGNPIGTNNIVTGNCIAGGRFGPIQTPIVGFTPTANLLTAPTYMDRDAGDLRLAKGSACAAFGFTLPWVTD